MRRVQSLLFSGGAPRPTRAELVNIKAGFCNTRDTLGRVIFDPFIASLDTAGRRDWYANKRAHGYTHIVLSPRYAYYSPTTPYPIPGKDMLDKPEEFAAFVREATQTPAADGKGFRVIVMLDDGAPDPMPRIDRYWMPLLDALEPMKDFIIICPGWELIKASDWTSADYSYALERIGPRLTVDDWEFWAHLSEGRAAFSSNPVEPDDPWQGAEKDCWYTHGGQYLTGLLYQSYAVHNGIPAVCDVASDSCYLNRWADVVPRLRMGLNGWRIVHLCWFEATAYFYFQGLATEGYSRDVATAAKDVARSFGVNAVSFGNGLPR